MLPPANCAFTIPSLNDGIGLHCRLHFPRRSSSQADRIATGLAIVAHPYAPLGGCYDDPTVQLVGSVLLKRGLILCTFNFRGAMGGPGSTSWTGKPELGDYVSVYMFMLHLMNAPDVHDHIAVRNLHDPAPLLVLGGYSYGSMMASHLPDLRTMDSHRHTAQGMSSDHEIAERAQEIAKVLLGYLETQLYQDKSKRLAENAPSSPNSRRGIVMGGYDSESPSRRASKESARKNVETHRIRHSIDRVRYRLSHKSNDNDSDLAPASHPPSPSVFAIRPRIAYLLVSPLLPPIAGFTTMFSKLSFERRGELSSSRGQSSASQNLTTNPTLAIYGDKDVFTSSRKLHKWASGLQSTQDSCFTFREVAGAGHFWHERSIQQQLCNHVREWVDGLSVSPLSVDDSIE